MNRVQTAVILATLTAAAFLSGGCVSPPKEIVPATQITGTIGGKPFSLTSPKNVSIAYLRVDAATNGTVSMTISNMSANVDDNAIQLAGAAYASSISAQGTAFVQMVHELSTGVGTLAGTAAGATAAGAIGK
jgi:hypothetical protein